MGKHFRSSVFNSILGMFNWKLERKNLTGFIHVLRNWIRRHFHTRKAGLTAVAFTKSWKRSTIRFSLEGCKDIAIWNVCTENCYKMRRNFVTKCALLQNAQKFCYKMRALLHNAQLLQNAPFKVLTKNWVNKSKTLTTNLEYATGVHFQEKFSPLFWTPSCDTLFWSQNKKIKHFH